MLAQERLGVEVFELDVGAQLTAEIAGGVAGHLPQLAQHPDAVVDRFGQFAGAEDEQADEDDDDELPAADVLQPHAVLPASRQGYAHPPGAYLTSATSTTWALCLAPSRWYSTLTPVPGAYL